MRIVCTKVVVDVTMRSGLELQMRANSLALLRMACGLLLRSASAHRCSSAGLSCLSCADGVAEAAALRANAMTRSSVFSQFSILCSFISANLGKKLRILFVASQKNTKRKGDRNFAVSRMFFFKLTKLSL